jgi:hypothetical protein
MSDADEEVVAQSDQPTTGNGSPRVDAHHPVHEAIEELVHRVRDLKSAAQRYIPRATDARVDEAKKCLSVLQENRPLLESPEQRIQVLAQKEVQKAIAQINRLKRSNVPLALVQGLFLGLFAAFDAFTGNLLRAIYARKPALYRAVNKTVTFGEVLAAASIDELKQQVLDEEIEDLRRKSYIEQFSTLAQRFDVKLTAFDSWPMFVERSQRRNLITHCDGRVTEQYLKICKSVGMKDSNLPELGSLVPIGAKYFADSAELVIEVGVKLGQTLWRKTLPAELKDADGSLSAALYSALEIGNWSRAKTIGEYAFDLRELSSDLERRIISINYAQALKRLGECAKAREVLDHIDWTAAINDFKLARAVIRDEYDQAELLMQRIGKKGELIQETSYHTWPLFREFRETEQFSRAYAVVYGYPYVAKLKVEADAASKKAIEQAELQSNADGLQLPEASQVSTTSPCPDTVLADSTQVDV